MKKNFLFLLPLLLLGSFYHSRASNWNDSLGLTAHDPMGPYTAGGCDEDNFINCYKSIMEYIEKGKTTIGISNATDAVIVIGLTRVGKSTATQFVANYSNPLIVKCEGTECYILDDSGDGGNDVISKTFVPNTVEHIDTNGVITPFYDMPGFDDTRGVAVEIANSFFIQRVIKGIQRIKTMIVAKHASFTSTETTFKNLMGSLMKFTRTPEKFKDSIILIGNMGYYNKEDEKHFSQYRKYLDKYNQSMVGTDSPHPVEDIPVVRGWINSFVETSTDNPAELTNVAVFRTPPDNLDGESIRDDTIFAEDYQKMKKLIWERTKFSPVTSHQVGFTLSIEAELFLFKATREASNGVRLELLNFTTEANEHLQTQLKVITESISEDEMAKFLANYNLIKMLKFQECTSLAESSPQNCVDELRTELASLVDELDSDVFDEIHTMTEFLQFAFADVKQPKEYNMAEWVTGFKEVPLNLEKDIKLRVDQLSYVVRARLTTFSNEVAVYLEKLVETASESASEVEMEILLAQFNTMKTLELTSCNKNPESPPEACINQISSQLHRLGNEMNNPVFQDISAR